MKHLLAIALGICAAMSASCSPTVPNDDYLDTWYSMRYYPIASYPRYVTWTEPQPSLWEPQQTEQSPTKHRQLRTWQARERFLPFNRKEKIGPFTVLSTRGQALLLDAAQRPVWAGSWAIPLHIDGKVGGLVLLDGFRNQVWQEGGLYHIAKVTFTTSTPVYEDLWDGYVSPGSFYGGVESWVADVDGDGCDEVMALSSPLADAAYSAILDNFNWELRFMAESSDTSDTKPTQGGKGSPATSRPARYYSLHDALNVKLSTTIPECVDLRFDKKAGIVAIYQRVPPDDEFRQTGSIRRRAKEWLGNDWEYVPSK